MVWRYYAAALAALTLSTCGGNSIRPEAPPTLEDAVRNLNSVLQTIPHVNSSDLASDERGRRYGEAKSIVRERQCSAGSANPLLLTSLPLDVRLTGNLAGDGKIQFSGVSADNRVASTRLTLEKDIEVLLRISTLSDLPNEYLKSMSALLEAKGLPAEVAKKLKQEVPGTHAALSNRVAALMADFDPTACRSAARAVVRPRESRPAKPLPTIVPPSF